MSVANKTGNKIMKDSIFMSLKIMKVCPFFFMSVALGLTVFMVIVGEKSLFLVPLFFLMIAVVALYTKWKLVLLHVGVASILTLFVLYHDMQQFVLRQWFLDTLVYLFIGLAVNRVNT